MTYVSSEEGLRELKLGRLVLETTERFDDPQHQTMRDEILTGAYFTQCDDPVEAFRGKRLRDIASPVWDRERLCGYWEYIDFVSERLRGQHPELILLPEAFQAEINLLLLRSDWIASHAFRNAIASLQEALGQSVYWYNVQFVAHLLVESHKIPFVRPSLLPDNAMELFRQEYSLVDHFCYSTAKRKLYALVNQAYDRMVSLQDVPTELMRLFLVNSEQLQEFGAVRFGKEPDMELFFPPAQEPEEQTPDEVEPGWQKRASGLYVPPA